MTDELKIEDLVVGDGKAAERGALITAHYQGLAGRWHRVRFLP